MVARVRLGSFFTFFAHIFSREFEYFLTTSNYLGRGWTGLYEPIGALGAPGEPAAEAKPVDPLKPTGLVLGQAH